MKLTFLLGVLFSLSGYTSILPENNLHLEDSMKAVNDIDETVFNAIIDSVAKVYTPIVEFHGGKLSMLKSWDDSTVNAYANRWGSTWNVKMFGGLARRKEVTPDGFALVVCHELGHHLAGFPFHEPNRGGDWAASEGQSDFFATQVCARRLWSRTPVKNAEFRDIVDPIVKQACDSVWHSERAQNLCYRISFASKSLATLLSSLALNAPAPEFNTPDNYEISETLLMHPNAQCRLDTYYQGSLCTQGYDITIIPGRSHQDGQASIEAELLSALYTCNEFEGFSRRRSRPKCWYKPELASNAPVESSAEVDSIEEQPTVGN